MSEETLRLVAESIERAAREVRELLEAEKDPPWRPPVPAPGPPTKAAVYPVGPLKKRSDRPPNCEFCGSEMRASKFKNQFYCVECYKARKESEEQR